MPMSEHKMSWASILIAIGAAATAIVTIPALPAALVIAATVVGIGATAAGYSVSRGMAKQGSVASSASSNPQPIEKKEP